MDSNYSWPQKPLRTDYLDRIRKHKPCLPSAHLANATWIAFWCGLLAWGCPLYISQSTTQHTLRANKIIHTHQNLGMGFIFLSQSNPSGYSWMAFWGQKVIVRLRWSCVTSMPAPNPPTILYQQFQYFG